MIVSRRRAALPNGGVRTTCTYEPLLGTLVELRIDGAPQTLGPDHASTNDDDVASTIESAVVGEIRRLEALFSVFDDASELSRWKRGQIDDVSDELRSLLATSLEWQRRSDGLYNPSVGVITAAWRHAEITGVPPGDEQLGELIERTGEPAYAVRADGLERVGDLRGLDLNAIAKGRIIDLATAAGMRAGAGLGVTAISLNIGGDLLHCGAGHMTVGIEDPHRPYDNVVPTIAVAIDNRALATSGSARRGFRVGGVWHSHVIDPRTGHPVQTVPSASVIAADATTADVVATIIGITSPEAGLAFAASLPDIGCCIVGADATVWRNDVWRAHEVQLR